MKHAHPHNHLCSLTLLGNLVAKPDIRYLANPVVAVAEFTVATHHKWFDKNTNAKKEWTHFHTVKMIGDVVEKTLNFADKGDVVLIQGHLVDSIKTRQQIIHATYAHTYAKGFVPSINQIKLSGVICSAIKLVETANHKKLAECTIRSHLSAFSPNHQTVRHLTIERTIHVWGKQAEYLVESATVDDEIIIDGNLSYINNKDKTQLIDVQQLVLPKT
nr:single-stranded DNA-binding protein [Thalassotalea sediminis]